ncbi:MAG: diguanylate cyclase [Candidatus Aquicultorales bacterium]
MSSLKLPLFVKLIVPVLVLVPLATGIISYLSFYTSKEILRQIALDQSRKVAGSVDHHFGGESRRLSLLAQRIAMHPDVTKALKSGDRPALSEALRSDSTLLLNEQIDVFDTKGVLLGSYAAGLSATEPSSVPEIIASANASHMELLRKERRVRVTYPARDKESVRGWVTVSQSLDDIIGPIKRTTGAAIGLYDPSGGEIYITDRRAFSGATIPFTKASKVGGQSVEFGRGGDSVLHLARPLTIGDKTAVIAFAIDFTEEDREIVQMIYLITAVIVVLGVVMLLGSFYGGRHLLRPMKDLVSTAKSIAGGDLSARASVKTNDEIEELSTVFNWMSDRLQQRISQAEEMAIADSLTGLYNHRYFYEQLSKEIERAERYNTSLAVLFCDIDNFKSFNDTNGHTFGDAALKSIAKLIQASVRSIDIAARYGGEEFAVILLEASPQQSLDIAERLRAGVAAHHFETRHNLEFPLTISAGIAAYPADGEEPEELISKADIAMYQAKSDGKNLVRVYGDQAAPVRVDREVDREIETLKEKMLLRAVFSLAVAVDTRDRYTRRHSEFVAKYAVEIAHRLPVSERFIKDLSIAALLHDAGKIGVPDSILNKCEPLAEDEWREIRRHPVLGADIAKNIGPDATVIKSIRHHHEHYDGTGYPDHLKGEDIPLGARIIAVVDSFHAMISDRPYRNAMMPRTAFGELVKRSGAQFDPGIVELFEEVLKEGRILTPPSSSV